MKFVRQFMIILAISFVGELLRITAAPGSGQHLRPRSYADRFTDRYTSTQCSK